MEIILLYLRISGSPDVSLLVSPVDVLYLDLARASHNDERA